MRYDKYGEENHAYKTSRKCLIFDGCDNTTKTHSYCLFRK